MKLLFWLSFGFIFYTYAGYPILLWLLSRFSVNEVNKKPITLSVSVVMSALNEESRIGARLDNLLAQNYPAEQFEIIVVSDGSTDRTAEIVRSFASRHVKLLELPERGGKAVAVNLGVAEASADIIVFTDARQEFRTDAIANLVANFADESVGCVSGELHFLEDPESKIEAEMGAYWKYEKFIRRSESASGSVVGATGCIYAIRRELYQPLTAGVILDDVLTPMNIARQGKRVLFESEAAAYDIISQNAAQEWQRKVRTLAGNWQILGLSNWIILPWSNPLWWRYLSHKLLRLLVPFGMVILFISSLHLTGGFFRIFAFMQLVFYGIALLGILIPATRSIRLVNLSYFFMVMNAAALAGFWKWLTGGCSTAWKSAYRDL